MDRPKRVWFKYSSNSWKDFVFDVDHEYLKQLHELHNDYPLAPDKVEIKKGMPNYQLKIADFIIFLLVVSKNLCLTFFIKKSMCFVMKACKFI